MGLFLPPNASLGKTMASHQNYPSPHPSEWLMLPAITNVILPVGFRLLTRKHRANPGDIKIPI